MLSDAGMCWHVLQIGSGMARYAIHAGRRQEAVICGSVCDGSYRGYRFGLRKCCCPRPAVLSAEKEPRVETPPPSRQARRANTGCRQQNSSIYITTNARAGDRGLQVDISTDKNTDKTQPQLHLAT